MKQLLIAISVLGIALSSIETFASPESDRKAFRAYYEKKFPKVKFDSYTNGVYALDDERRKAWEDWESFAPPYTAAIEYGKKVFNTKFANGKSFADCFKNRGIGIRQGFPYFDTKSGKIVTAENAINDCRVKNGETPFPWGTGDLASVSAYMAYTSRGKRLTVRISDDPRALAIYERGKRFFFAKRGQLNFSCADCHVFNAGNMVRADLLSSALGQAAHWPVWRQAWASTEASKGNKRPDHGLGTIQHRYAECNKQIRAAAYPQNGDDYNALEYFHTFISSGIPTAGPALRQ